MAEAAIKDAHQSIGQGAECLGMGMALASAVGLVETVSTGRTGQAAEAHW